MLLVTSLSGKFWNKTRKLALKYYCGMQACCWATISKEAAIQQPLLSNGFVNKHVFTATI
jgi:hypothetical protein